MGWLGNQTRMGFLLNTAGRIALMAVGTGK
jgi:hypothetical protein